MVRLAPGDSDEFGVSYDIHAKKLDDAAETEGLHMCVAALLSVQDSSFIQA